jgi:hypothetical protein
VPSHSVLMCAKRNSWRERRLPARAPGHSSANAIIGIANSTITGNGTGPLTALGIKRRAGCHFDATRADLDIEHRMTRSHMFRTMATSNGNRTIKMRPSGAPTPPSSNGISSPRTSGVG